MVALADILWAEDSVHDQRLVRASLQELRRRASITFVEDGRALLEALRTARPRLVVLDLQMPRMNGIETLQRLRQAAATREMPVVMFTSSSHPADLEACRRLQVADYVTKPMEFTEFCAAVDRVLAALRLVRVRT